ncbi:MAG: acyl-CoA thioesterase [Desulfuromonadaceae bacterium]
MRYHETKITVRFNEIDAYRVAWHGHYVAWMEIGRNNLAGRFDLGAFQLAAAGYLGPVVALELKFLRPACFNDELTIRTTLRRTETATLEFVTTIVGPDGKKCATGTTTHALTDLDGVLQFQLPPVIAERVDRLLASLELP